MRYFDTSAFLKLIVAEDHSLELREAMTGADLWSSVLLDVEAHRAARRLGVSADAVSQALEAVALITLGDDAVRNARSIGEDGLRTLDALHLATALELGDDLEAVVTYDRRLAAAAADEGVAVESPGLPPNWWVAGPS
jgi:uncharacterized protein